MAMARFNMARLNLERATARTQEPTRQGQHSILVVREQRRLARSAIAVAPFIDLLEYLLDGFQRVIGVRFEATHDPRIVGCSECASKDEVLFVDSRFQPIFADA